MGGHHGGAGHHGQLLRRGEVVLRAGALGASCLWFTLLGYGGSALAGLLNRPRTWQVIDAGVGVTMLVVAGLLAFGG
ncbi:hypothetical protein BCY76_017145 [Nesterenkonia sp. PF2B19]|nr:LysE family transporter [Nesterenkonia sp. PF2B19]OSM41993.1 hypothetical protein BCY76_017145 [Nesterenkonia sp. PF2B19]